MGHDGLFGYNPQGHGVDGGHATLEHIASTVAQAYVPRCHPETRTTNDNICTPCTLVFSRSHTSTRDRSEAFEPCGRIVRSVRRCGGNIIQTLRFGPERQFCVCRWEVQASHVICGA